MLVAMAMALACSLQDQTTEQPGENLGDAALIDPMGDSGGLEAESADRQTLDLERRYRGACAALGGSNGAEAGKAAAAELFLPSFLALARGGNPRAIAWCLEHQEAWRRLAPPHPAQRAVRRNLWEALLACAMHQQPFLEQTGAIEWLAEEQILPRREAASLADRFAALPLDARLRVMALYARALLTAPWGTNDTDRIGEAVTLLRRASALLSEPDPLVQKCNDAIFRLQALAIGCPAPAFTGEDAHGNEIRLDDYLGKIVLIRFWSFDDPRAQERLEADRTRVRQYWDRRFALVGVNGDSDSRKFIDRCEDMEIHWPNARHAAQADAGESIWHIDSSATILLDHKGIVRGVDLEGAALDAAIQELVQGLERKRSSEGPSDHLQGNDGDRRR